MPDRNGFNELGTDVRCIWCEAGGPRWDWPDDRRYDHHLDHERPRRAKQLERDRGVEAKARRERRHRSLRWVKSHEPRACGNPYCATVFTPERVSRIFCSDRCRKAVARQDDR